MKAIPLNTIEHLFKDTQTTLQKCKTSVENKSDLSSAFEDGLSMYTEDSSSFNQLVNQMNDYINFYENDFGALLLAQQLLERSEIKHFEIDFNSDEELTSLINFPENILLDLSHHFNKKFSIRIPSESQYYFRTYLPFLKSKGFPALYCYLLQYIITRCEVDIFVQFLRLNRICNSKIVEIKYGKKTDNAITQPKYRTNVPTTFNLTNQKYVDQLQPLLKKLQDIGLIAESVNLTNFKNCFLGVKTISAKILWTGNPNQLSCLINILIQKNLIEKNKYKYQIIQNCFESKKVDFNSHKFHGDNKPPIAEDLDKIISDFKKQLLRF
ncbi:hypothetical protein [Pedobacter sp.]